MKKIIPVFISHKGCPFKCIFCDQRTITSSNNPSITKLHSIITDKLKSLSQVEKAKLIIEIAFYGGTFTGLSFDEMKKYLSVANQFSEIDYIRISTRPDYINKDILDFLMKNNVRVIELGVQSMDDAVLSATRRGYDAKRVVKSSLLIKEFGFKLGHQLMIGLQRQNKESFFNTLSTVIQLKPDMIRIYPTVVFKGTQLAKLYANGLYKPLSIQEGAKLSAEAIIRLRKAGIEILRIGLHSIKDKNSILAGCYHPQFRYIAESYVLRKLMTDIFTKLQAPSFNSLTCAYRIYDIEIDKKLLNYFKGFKKMNIKYFKEKGIYLNIKTINLRNKIKVNKKEFYLTGIDL